MAKNDDARVRTAIDNETQRSNNQNSQLWNQFQDQYSQARNDDSALRQSITDRYTNFNPQYNIDDYLAKSGYGGGGGDGGPGGTAFSIIGGLDPNKIDSYGSEAYGGFRNLASGLDQDFWNDYNKYREGLDESIGSYKNFIDTGGFKTGELDAIRERNLAPTRAIYGQAQNDMSLQQRRQGLNANPAAIAAMARQSNQAISDANINSEASLAGMIQEGRKFGTSGLESATMGGMNSRAQVEQIDAQMRNMGLSGMSDIEKARLAAQLENQNLNQKASIAQAQMAESAAGRSASASSANAAQQLAIARMRMDADELRNSQLMGATGGLLNLYNSTPGATQLANQSLLDLYGQGNAANANLINSRISGSQLPGRFQSIMGNIGSAANVAGQFASGFGGFMPGGGASAPMQSTRNFGEDIWGKGFTFGDNQNPRVWT